jgi:phytol kinase
MIRNMLDSQIFMLAFTLIFLSGLYIALHFVKNKYEVSAEMSRKMVHIGLGLTTLSFPWIFHDTWPVWVMCGVSIVTLVGLRHKKFRNNLGQALHSVERTSYGEICFPISVAILFQLSHHDPVFYIIPLLVLTLADAFAAIVGVRYGKSHYNAAEGIKSMEGSLFFFITAFLCVQIPLLLMSDFGNAQIILVALFIALLITLCEAVSWQGLDNLFIPLGAYMVLTHYLYFELNTLILLSGFLVAIVIAAGYIRERSTMNLSALLSCVVMGFLFLTFEPLTFVIPLSMLLLYTFIARKKQGELKNSHTVLTIFYLNLGGMFWLFLNSNTNHNFSIEFSIYYCIQMGVISWIHQKVFYGKNKYMFSVINTIFLYTALFMLYSKTWNVFTDHQYFYYMGYTLLALGLSIFIFRKWANNYDEIPSNRERHIMQGGTAFLGSVVFLMLRSFYA